MEARPICRASFSASAAWFSSSDAAAGFLLQRQWRAQTAPMRRVQIQFSFS
jgi:hypothetical protein